jgi:predicted amidophosphoribosyltransferase
MDNAQSTQTAAGATVVCVRCETRQPAGTRRCGNCREYLYTHCSHCGQKSPRSEVYCQGCTRRIRRPWWKKMQRKYLRPQYVTAFRNLIFCAVGIYIGYRIVIRLSEM